MAEKLKLRAEDGEDIQVVSACLQDALVSVGDMKFIKDDKRFVLIANRFCWEDAAQDDFPAMDDGELGGEPDDEETYQRVHCGVRFETVSGVRTRGFNPADNDSILELLAVTVEDDGTDIRLIFSGDAEILLKTERILCMMEDLDEHWPTSFRPKHPVAPSGQKR
jgi:Protein of unknown function (DUF2948)